MLQLILPMRQLLNLQLHSILYLRVRMELIGMPDNFDFESNKNWFVESFRRAMKLEVGVAEIKTVENDAKRFIMWWECSIREQTYTQTESLGSKFETWREFETYLIIISGRKLDSVWVETYCINNQPCTPMPVQRVPTSVPT
eukprot:UN23726